MSARNSSLSCRRIRTSGAYRRPHEGRRISEVFVDRLIASPPQLSLTISTHWVSTATQSTVECIASHYERYFPDLLDEVVLTGGGAHNLEIRRRLQSRLPTCAIWLHYGVRRSGAGMPRRLRRGPSRGRNPPGKPRYPSEGDRERRAPRPSARSSCPPG